MNLEQKNAEQSVKAPKAKKATLETIADTVTPVTKKRKKLAKSKELLESMPSKHSKQDKIEKKEKVLDTVNTAKAIVENSTDKQSKYLYPENVKTSAEKKTFRRNARAQRTKYEAAIAKLMDSVEKKDKAELKKLEAEVKTWEKDIYLSGVIN